MRVNLGPYLTNEELKGDVQRVEEVHIDDYDTWNMDNTLALIIYPLLKKFKENLHGFPSEMYKLVGVTELTGQETDEESDAAEKKWVEILDEMIWAFGEVAHGENEPLKLANWKVSDQVLKEEDVYQDRIQKGVNLFAEYFRNLWD